MQDKFRVWCKNKNEWEKDLVMLAPDGVLYTEYKGRWIPVKADTHIVEFSTGLLAAKSYRGESEADRLIFEGDIILIDDGTNQKWVVKWVDGRFAAVCGEQKFCWYVFCKVDGADYQIEIINTIHDTKEEPPCQHS